MNRISELVERLCPEGVEWKTLGEVAEIGTGSSNTNEGLKEGLYPFFSCSQKPLQTNKYEFDETAIITAGNANVGKVFFYVEGKYRLYQRAYRIVFNTPELLPKFYYYYMQSAFPSYIEKIMNVSCIAFIRRSMLTNFPIPTPSLEIQSEIVGILDKFKELVEGLEEELVARKKQYSYYRDVLLSFNEQTPPVIRNMLSRLCPNGVEYKTLGEILTIKNGKDYKKHNKGDIPVYGSGGVIAHINKYVYDKPTVLIPRKGSLNKIYYVEKPFWNCDTIFYTIIDENVALPRYVYHCLIKEDLESLNVAGGVPSLTKTILNKIKIPLPPLEIQHKIVEILDKFDTLTTSLTEGIPAEIEARRKQYQYYREKLLSFKEKQ